MRKNGFTLIEVIISIALIGLLSIFATSLIFQTKQSIRVGDTQQKNDLKLQRVETILYQDIFQASKIEIKSGKKFDILHIRSKNSIYGIANPYILWFVSKKNDTLVRIESAKEISLPIDIREKNYIFLDTTIKECESFSINLSKDKKSILYFIKFKNHSPIIFEVKRL